MSYRPLVLSIYGLTQKKYHIAENLPETSVHRLKQNIKSA